MIAIELIVLGGYLLIGLVLGIVTAYYLKDSALGMMVTALWLFIIPLGVMTMFFKWVASLNKEVEE